jgi:hypothetical protein
MRYMTVAMSRSGDNRTGLDYGGLNETVDAFEEAVVNAGCKPTESAVLMAADGFGHIDDGLLSLQRRARTSLEMVSEANREGSAQKGRIRLSCGREDTCGGHEKIRHSVNV